MPSNYIKVNYIELFFLLFVELKLIHPRPRTFVSFNEDILESISPSGFKLLIRELI